VLHELSFKYSAIRAWQSFVAMAYALGIGSDMDLSTQDTKTLQDFKDIYRKKRNEFRSNPRAMEELLEWKRKNDRFNFKILYASCHALPAGVNCSCLFPAKALANYTFAYYRRPGLVSAKRVGEMAGNGPLGSSDTDFSVRLLQLAASHLSLILYRSTNSITPR